MTWSMLVRRETLCLLHSGYDFIRLHRDERVPLWGNNKHELRWVQKRMEASFLVKVIGHFGGDPIDLAELRVLNRVLRWTDEGILLEADPRHQEILVAAEPGLPVLTLGVKEQPLGAVAEARLRRGGHWRVPVQRGEGQIPRHRPRGHRLPS